MQTSSNKAKNKVFIKSHIIFLTVIFGHTVFLFSPSVKAEFPICKASGNQWFTSISGDIVVWQDSRNGSNDIYGYNLSTKTEFPICTVSGDQWFPSVSGDIVVWEDYRNGNGDIYGYNIKTGTEFPICTVSYNQSAPSIDGDIVVWSDRRNASVGIYGYNISTQTEFPICTVYGVQIEPAISGDIVVWEDYRNGFPDNPDIYGYDLSTQTEFPVCTAPDHQDNPSVSGDTIVWEDDRNTFNEIYGYNLQTSTEFYISGAASVPSISGDIVVWTGYDIYGYSLSTQREFPVSINSLYQEYPSISGDIVVWHRVSYDLSTYDIYGINLRDTCFFDIRTPDTEVIEDVLYWGTTGAAMGEDISNCGQNDPYDVWYWYVPTQGGTVQISTEGSNFDTTLSVYLSCIGPDLACNDDYSLDNTQSRIILDVVKGKTYYIRIAGTDAQRGEYNLRITRIGCLNRLQSDANGDCKVDFLDFSILAGEWLNCGLANQQDCW